MSPGKRIVLGVPLDLAVNQASSFTACKSSLLTACKSSLLGACKSSLLTACKSSLLTACKSSLLGACKSSLLGACKSSLYPHVYCFPSTAVTYRAVQGCRPANARAARVFYGARCALARWYPGPPFPWRACASMLCHHGVYIRTRVALGNNLSIIGGDQLWRPHRAQQSCDPGDRCLA